MESSEPALRRSKREHQPSAKAAASAASSSLSAAGSSAARRLQRRRVTHSSSPAFTPASTRNSSPVRGTLNSPASSKEPVSVAVDVVGPNGQRRRLRAAAHTGTTSSVPHGVQSGTGRHDDGKVLGRYSSHDCALLCEVIMGQLKRQTLAPMVLEERKSPAYIRWEPVAKKMETTHKLRMTPRECQLLWKFLAYGQVPVHGAEDELLPDSDEEDFHKTPKQINAELAAKRTASEEVEVAVESKEGEQVSAPDSTAEGRQKQVTEGEAAPQQSESTQKDKSDSSATGKGKEDAPKVDDEQESASAVRLYPTYSLPTGAPDAWHHPFAPKDALPLTFVASRFLRRKATPPLTQSMYSQAVATSAAGAADLKRKQQTSAMSAAGSKKPKIATPPVSTPPRTFTPSSTPPPAAQRARSQLEFFELRLREEQAKTTPGSKFELSAADIQRRFGEASPEVRRQCQVLAAQDVERFNREVVRVRIWQKAMGANNTKPLSTLAPAPAAAAKSVSTSNQAASTKPATTNSAGTASAGSSSTKAPAVTKSSGPTAALLAHAAAVAATAAKARGSEPTNTTAGAPNSGKEGSATTKAETK